MTLGVCSLMSAKTPIIEEDNNITKLVSEEKLEIIPSKICSGVESDCGAGGVWFACDYPNIDGEVDHEVKDEMRQLLNEAFCGY